MPDNLEGSKSPQSADEMSFHMVALGNPDLAWGNALLFELIAAAYSAVARNRYDEWRNVLVKIHELPADDVAKVFMGPVMGHLGNATYDPIAGRIANALLHRRKE